MTPFSTIPPKGLQSSSSPNLPPFLIEHRRRDEKPNGTFTPDARLTITPALRAGDLLQILPDTEARSLVALLACLGANGRIEAHAVQIAALLGVSEGKALARLHRLCSLTWQETPLVFERTHESGWSGFVPSHHLVGEEVISQNTFDTTATTAAMESFEPLAGRAALIARSRTAYAHPRAEVEKNIAQQLGHTIEPPKEYENDPVARQLAQRLLALGVRHDEMDALLAAHSTEEITEQLDWLPLRGAKSPARFIVAAIQNRYEPPARIRLERAVAADNTFDNADEESEATELGEAVSSATPQVEAEEASSSSKSLAVPGIPSSDLPRRLPVGAYAELILTDISASSGDFPTREDDEEQGERQEEPS